MKKSENINKMIQVGRKSLRKKKPDPKGIMNIFWFQRERERKKKRIAIQRENASEL